MHRSAVTERALQTAVTASLIKCSAAQVQQLADVANAILPLLVRRVLA